MKFFLFWGFLLWLSATFIFRFVGHVLFPLDAPFILLITFALTIPGILLTTLPIYRLKHVAVGQKSTAALSIAIPGMILDIFSILNFYTVFPNLSTESLPIVTAWLFWAYSLILFTGFWGQKG